MFSMKLDHAFNVSQQSINILYKSVLNNSIYNLNRVVILIHLTFFPAYVQYDKGIFTIYHHDIFETK